MSTDDSKVICRDYLRNVCSRGDTCKYRHPPGKYVFCHDYQKGRCKRDECLFVHCSRDDEEHYKQTGELPPHLNDLPQVTGFTICKDYLRGECFRLTCKYQHPRKGRPYSPPPVPQVEYNMQAKRIRYESEIVFDSRYTASMWNLEAENSMLKKSITDLKKKVNDLQATNEFLLEQNAQMRIKDKVSAGLTTVTVPAVTLTNAAQLPNPNATALRAVTATVPVSLAAVAATPVSIATVSMAPVQIPAQTVAMTQESSQTAAAQSLVSYPIMATSMITSTLQHQ